MFCDCSGVSHWNSSRSSPASPARAMARFLGVWNCSQSQITEGLLLAFAILLEIPIAMIFLSRVLKYRANRWANIIAAVITIVFVIGGGSTDLHYLFFATVEVVLLAIIIWYAWKWPNPEGRSTD